MIHANSICQEFLAYKTAARIDIQIEITPVPFKDISKAQPGEPSAAIRERVVRACQIDADPAGYHPCSTADQVVHVGCIVPGDHEGAQRKQDFLEGMKENVICGHLIPAGTGLRQWDRIIVGSREEYDRMEANKKNVIDFSEQPAAAE